MFMTSPADIVIYGGSAGGGKTYALLTDPLRHIHRPRFKFIILRRTMPEIKQPGGLWDESCEIYPHYGGFGTRFDATWRFPNGAIIKMMHMQDEKDRLRLKGGQVDGLAYDELCDFTENQFYYPISRLRGSSGIRPYVRASCNPDPDSFVSRLIHWWIDWETGLAIPERSGVIRWFSRSRQGDRIDWADSREQFLQLYGEDSKPKSLTFIRSRLEDNRILMAANPDYESSLNVLSRVDRARLKDGNWKIRATAGNVFKREWFETVKAAPAMTLDVRYWDRASTKDAGDWTCGMLMGRSRAGIYYIKNIVRLQGTPFEVERAITTTASQDGTNVAICLEQDPGSAGVAEVGYLIRQLAGYRVNARKVSVSKQDRAKPLSSQAEAGNVKIVEARWNDTMLTEFDNFPDGANDDVVDSGSGAFNELVAGAFGGGHPVDLPRDRERVERPERGMGLG